MNTDVAVAGSLAGRLVLDGVEFGSGSDRRADQFTVELIPGQTLAITGPAGSGKTTALMTIAGLRKPAAGSILVDGGPVEPPLCGIASQQHELVRSLTAVENVAVPVLARHGFRRDDWARIEALLAALELPESSWHNLLEQLSGGQQQRVAIARALIGSPRLILLDDPTSELDPATAELVWRVIQEFAGPGANIVIATSDAAIAAECDRAIQLTP